MLKSGELSRISNKVTIEALRKRLLKNFDREDQDVVARKILNFKTNTSLGETIGEDFYLNDHEILRCMDLPDKDLFLYLRYRFQFKQGADMGEVLPFPAHLLIEPVSYCNLKCVMCFQVDKTFSGNKSFMGKMDFDLFKKCIDEARIYNCRGLTLASRGEPTLHPQLNKFLEYCAPCDNHQFFDFKLNTNATRMDDSLCHAILKSQVNLLVYSVDSDNKDQYEKIRVGGKFEKVLENIKKMKVIKQKHYPESKLRTRVSGVLVDNQKIEDIEAFWSPYVDEVSLIKNMPRWDSYNNSLMQKESTCNVLWQRMYVWYDGVCNPCDFDYKSYLEVGNAKDDSLSSIWQSDRYQELRRKHLEKERGKLVPCDRCPF